MSKGTFESVGGRQTHFGPRGVSPKYGRPQSRVGQDVEVVYEFDYNDLPLAATDSNEMVHTIPDESHILEVSLQVLEAFDGTDGSTTNPFLTVGVAAPDGTSPDADGLVVVDGLTDIDAYGDLVVGSGAVVGTAVSTKAQVTAALDGSSSLTAGKAKLYVRYRAPEEAAAGQKTY